MCCPVIPGRVINKISKKNFNTSFDNDPGFSFAVKDKKSLMCDLYCLKENPWPCTKGQSWLRLPQVCVCLPWSRCRVGECVSAGGGLETSGWADRAHTHCRCPSPYHSATLTHTERQSVCLIWLQLIVPLQNYHKSKQAINISVSPGRWCWTLIDNCRTNSRGSLTTSCMENKASVKLLLHLCKAPLTPGSVLILSSSWKR